MPRIIGAHEPLSAIPGILFLTHTHPNMKNTPRTVILATILLAFSALPVRAQAQAKSSSPAAAKSDTTPLIGTWMGLVTVSINDTTLQVPVSYTFTQTSSGIAGTAVVPGQGQGAINSVEREGSRVRFRVTVTTNDATRQLHHEGTLNGTTFEGAVHMDAQLVAKFKLSPARPNGAK